MIYDMECDEISQECEELLGSIDDIIDQIGSIIEYIAVNNDDFICSACIETARRLYSIIKEYGDENACADISAKFNTITGMYIENK